MTTDTAQPGLAAENVALDDAAHAFKVHLGQVEPKEQTRDDRGRFASDASEEEEIEAEAGADDAAVVAESHGDDEAGDEAADDAQPTVTDLPTTWAADKAEMWTALPPDVQAYIAQRDGEQTAATNAKFEDAANARKQAEAIAAEASTSRTHHLAALDQMLSLFESEPPDPKHYVTDEGFDQFGYANAQHQHAESLKFADGLKQQREQLVAQHGEAAFNAEYQATLAANQIHGPKLVEMVPELGKAETADKALMELADYAISLGLPEKTFKSRSALLVSALEWQIIAKAREYDRQQAAKAKVRTEPKPQPKAAPVVRPGVPPTRSAAEGARLKGSMERLSRSGSVEDGAAVFKHFMKKGF